MSIIIKPKTFEDNENVVYSDLNSLFDRIYNDYNGNITNANVSSSAAIAESKISFSSTGHTHNGIDSALIPQGGVLFSIPGELFVDNNYVYTTPVIFDSNRNLTKCRVVCGTAPTGSDIIVDVQRSIDNGATFSSLWNTNTQNRPKITANNKVGSTTSFDISTIEAEMILIVKVLQVGSTVAGSDLTIELF